MMLAGEPLHPDSFKQIFAKQKIWVVGLKYFLFSPLPGEMIQFD